MGIPSITSRVEARGFRHRIGWCGTHSMELVPQPHLLSSFPITTISINLLHSSFFFQSTKSTIQSLHTLKILPFTYIAIFNTSTKSFLVLRQINTWLCSAPIKYIFYEIKTHRKTTGTAASVRIGKIGFGDYKNSRIFCDPFPDRTIKNYKKLKSNIVTLLVYSLRNIVWHRL